jgi:serine/threonine protein kinase
MAQNAQDLKTGLDNKENKELLIHAIKGSDLSYVQEGGTNKVLGAGGYGTVYLGTYRHEPGHVAIKELFIKNAPAEMIKEFENEATIMEKLRSGYLVQFYGYCLSPRYCLVMEFMPEGSLYQLLRSNKPLDWSIRYQISMEMSLGLEYLHGRNILHRDIKSLNVLLKNGHAKLSDFGLSRLKSPSNNSSGRAVGTVQWKAPELLQRRPQYSQKSDIYSLGMTFWEIASRQIPFKDLEDDQATLAVLVVQGEREEIPEDCPKKFASLIFSCWKGQGIKADKRWLGNPSDRPSARQIVDYLRSNEDDFETFIGKPAVNNDTSQNSAPISAVPNPQPAYQNNLNSMLSPAPKQNASSLGAADLKAFQDSIAPSPALGSPIVQLQSHKVPVQQPFRINAELLQTFLNHIAWGRQDEAEALLKANKDLGLAAGDVTDHAKRTFRNITGFQLAVWNLDWHMWTMILRYLSSEAAKEQAQGFKTGAWVKEHAEHANWKNVIDALQLYIDKYDSWNWEQREKHWIEQIGSTQFKLPIHVLQEYNNPNRPFDGAPNFSAQYALQRSLPIWLNNGLQASRFDFGILRFNFDCATCGGVMVPKPDGWGLWRLCASGLWVPCGWRGTGQLLCVLPDRLAIVNLYDTRRQQREKLETQLLASNASQTLKPVGK